MITPADPENEHQALGWQTWRERRAQLEAEHGGKYVLIHDQDVVGVFDGNLEALREGLAKFPPGTFLIKGIGLPPIPEAPPPKFHFRRHDRSPGNGSAKSVTPAPSSAVSSTPAPQESSPATPLAPDAVITEHP